VKFVALGPFGRCKRGARRFEDRPAGRALGRFALNGRSTTVRRPFNGRRVSPGFRLERWPARSAAAALMRKRLNALLEAHVEREVPAEGAAGAARRFDPQGPGQLRRRRRFWL